MVEIQETPVFKKWMKRLKDRHASVQISFRLDRLAKGNPGDFKALGDGVNELRIHCGPGYRIYFTWKNQKLIVLLCAGDKSKQDSDIKLAKKIALKLED